MNLNFFVYGKADTSNETANKIRSSMGWEGHDIYIITNYGTPWIAQSDTVRPYTDCTVEECAQRQIDEILANQGK